MNPFKTPGTYGFAHGGLAPQELVTPYFCWEQESDVMGELPVTIANKHDLVSVTGELYQLKLRAESGEGNMFTLDRKVMLLFFANKAQVNKSDVITVQSNGQVTKEYTFDGHNEIEVQLVDAMTKQQLDRVLIKRITTATLADYFKASYVKECDRGIGDGCFERFRSQAVRALSRLCGKERLSAYGKSWCQRTGICIGIFDC